MTDIKPNQIWAEALARNETRQFTVMNVLGKQVQVLDNDSAVRAVYPHGRTLNSDHILTSPAKFKLISDVS